MLWLGGDEVAPAVKARVVREVRHDAMSFCLAGIVATMVLSTFQVSLPFNPKLLFFLVFSLLFSCFPPHPYVSVLHANQLCCVFDGFQQTCMA